MISEHIKAAIKELEDLKLSLLTQIKDVEFKIFQLKPLLGETVQPVAAPKVKKPRGKITYEGGPRTSPIGMRVREILNDGQGRTFHQIKAVIGCESKSPEANQISTTLHWLVSHKFVGRTKDGVYRKLVNYHRSPNKPKATAIAPVSPQAPVTPQSPSDLIPKEATIVGVIRDLLNSNPTEAYRTADLLNMGRQFFDSKWANHSDSWKKERIGIFLQADIKSGKIRRVAPGLYASLNYKGAAPQPGNGITRVVVGALGRGQELNAETVYGRVSREVTDLYPGLTETQRKGRVSAILSSLANQGKLIRVREGVYTFK